ncbi:hypothetical protein EIK77_008581 [Talaromyces pinophilus]|jgi:2,4-dienoyl-CoA reductase-like NADH-dependent reductase (Old Yellow Enzyme family)|uniref:NADH:flavin oxidoreductase/NADH oxidase N-terminal domain-containing protein n=1 Tax=Talaromyces pinophilus TaxID=128442 RepID=A0A6V8HJG1_TALPI|nr:hypothetical protein EIK77_008581 [Talaromyces pinophilus]PCG95363.1 Aldolase-type TIM barrel [Penicillium occitanis (nom. inval.)]PCH02856.1 hypothetical protein PENOC_041400 [Penicillium occitanis (nom. inval.)]GAM41525.1 hypothetical protein TCE0_042f14709 [Talaromyces pinophilus]
MAPIRYQSEDADVSLLGRPLHFEFSGRTAQNRFLKAAMTERLASWDPKDLTKRGIPSKELINVYRRWGEGGFGIILTGNLMIEYDQLEFAGNTIIPLEAPCHGERFEAFKEMAAVSKKHGALIIAQVSHPGRQVPDDIQKNPISASDVHLDMNLLGTTFAKPHAASLEEIQNVVNGFAHCAEYLEKAGFDGIELHGAHGYLLSQFISEKTNRRTDQYGGTLENRARLILEIAQEVRKRVKPSFVLGIKLNSVEFQDKGLQPEEAQKLCVMLENNKFDFVELSGGDYENLAFVHKRESTIKREAFFLDFAEKITPSLKKTRSYITGGLRTAGAMVKALGACDGVGIGRPSAQEFYLPRDILDGKVSGAIKQKLDQQDYGPTMVAAGTQIRQVGKDHQPIDLSEQSNVDAFRRDMELWVRKLEHDDERKEYGYADIISVQPIPFGSG